MAAPRDETVTFEQFFRDESPAPTRLGHRIRPPSRGSGDGGGDQPPANSRSRIVRTTCPCSANTVPVRVLVDPAPGILQLVATLGVPRPLGVGGVALATGDLDDDAVGLELEVHPGDRPAAGTMDDLGHGSRQSGRSHQSQEPPLEERVTAAVREQLVEGAGAPSTRSAERGESLRQHDRCRGAGPDGGVDRRFQAHRGDACSGQVDDRAGCRRAAISTDGHPIDRRHRRGGVHSEQPAGVPALTAHREFDGVRQRPIEAVQASSSLVADDGVRSEAQQPESQPAIDRRRSAVDPVHPRGHRTQPAAAHQRPESVRADAPGHAVGRA